MNSSRLLVGWREWVALPKLNLPVVKAKMDTGAKTSALHAFAIEPFIDSHGVSKVRFQVHPLQGRKDILVTCEAVIVDYRFVSDSGGHRERRFVIHTPIQIGDQTIPIEITLANRESMVHRMLIGRSALQHFIVDPLHTYLFGKPEKIRRAYPKNKTKSKRATGKLAVKTSVKKSKPTSGLK